MARFSQTAGHMKLAADDIVSVMGVKGKVQQVMVMPTEGHKPAVLVTVDLTRGAGMPNMFNLHEIEAVKLGSTEWVNLQGEPVTV